jgi:hypothetical protein
MPDIVLVRSLFIPLGLEHIQSIPGFDVLWIERQNPLKASDLGSCFVLHTRQSQPSIDALRGKLDGTLQEAPGLSPTTYTRCRLATL